MRICLDSNCLRDKGTMSQAVSDAARAGGQVLLPDVLLGEMVKSSDWRSTMRSSLRYLRAHSRDVIVADGIGPRLWQERDTRKACCDLYDEVLTLRFRRFLDKFDSDEAAALAEIKSGVEAARPNVGARLRMAESFHAHNLGDMDKYKLFLTDETLRQLKKPNLSVVSRILESEFINDICRRVLIHNGYDEENAAILAVQDSVSRRNFLAHEASLLRWLAMGGLTGRKMDQIGNDHMDLEVAVVGTYCDETRTSDTIVRDLDIILRPICSGLGKVAG